MQTQTPDDRSSSRENSVSTSRTRVCQYIMSKVEAKAAVKRMTKAAWHAIGVSDYAGGQAGFGFIVILDAWTSYAVQKRVWTACIIARAGTIVPSTTNI